MIEVLLESIQNGSLANPTAPHADHNYRLNWIFGQWKGDLKFKEKLPETELLWPSNEKRILFYTVCV